MNRRGQIQEKAAPPRAVPPGDVAAPRLEGAGGGCKPALAGCGRDRLDLRSGSMQRTGVHCDIADDVGDARHAFRRCQHLILLELGGGHATEVHLGTRRRHPVT